METTKRGASIIWHMLPDPQRLAYAFPNLQRCQQCNQLDATLLLIDCNRLVPDPLSEIPGMVVNWNALRVLCLCPRCSALAILAGGSSMTGARDRNVRQDSVPDWTQDYKSVRWIDGAACLYLRVSNPERDLTGWIKTDATGSRTLPIQDTGARYHWSTP